MRVVGEVVEEEVVRRALHDEVAGPPAWLVVIGSVSRWKGSGRADQHQHGPRAYGPGMWSRRLRSVPCSMAGWAWGVRAGSWGGLVVGWIDTGSIEIGECVCVV